MDTRIPTPMKIRPATKMELDASATEITKGQARITVDNQIL